MNLSRKKKYLLVLSGIIFAVISAELALSISHFSIDPNIYKHDSRTNLLTLTPKAQFPWIKSCFKNYVTVNKFGFHDNDFNIEKPPDTFRIAILGDSQVESLQVPLQKTFHKLLENKLNDETHDGRRYEVMGLGHSGNGTYLNLLYLNRYALDFKPDVVIDLFLPGNDLRDDSITLTKQYIAATGDTAADKKFFPNFNTQGLLDRSSLERYDYPAPPATQSGLKRTLRHSVLARSVYHKYLELKNRPPKPKSEPNSIPTDYQIILKEYPPEWEKAWKIESELLRVMNERVNEAGAKFLLVSSGDAFRVHPPELLTALGDAVDFKKPEKQLTAIAKKLDFPYLPLFPTFHERTAAENQQMMFPCDGHWNEHAHRWAADTIFEYLITNQELIQPTLNLPLQ